jgi:hypothetical protein
MSPSAELNDSIETTIEYVEGEGSGYTVKVDLLDPNEYPALEKQGYGSPFALFTVFAGAEVFTDHDRFRLIRQMPGNNKWLHDHLERLENDLRE